MRTRHVRTYVGKALVRGHQKPMFNLHSAPQLGVWSSPHTLVNDSNCIVPCLAQQFRYRAGQILIHLDSH